jgi:O-methyltransferase
MRRIRRIPREPREFNLITFMKKYPVITDMMGRNQIYGILYYIKKMVDNGIEGDIVELGCNIGTTSIFIKSFLDIYAPSKKLYVYDSWDGLPEIQTQDKSKVDCNFKKGSCKVSRENFINTFKNFNIDLPVINSGWFGEIPDKCYPEKICLAFYDGDFYSSIIDSFNKTYNKLQKGGIIIIDDIGGSSLDFHPLPGAERACIDFLKDKKENYDYLGYPDKNLKFDLPSGGARIIKE